MRARAPPRQWRYLVSWRGYGDEHDTWEPAAHIAPALVAAYDRRHPLARPAYRVGEAVEARQRCLALAQLACREDPLQLARASAELAAVYLQSGSAAAAAARCTPTGA